MPIAAASAARPSGARGSEGAATTGVEPSARGARLRIARSRERQGADRAAVRAADRDAQVAGALALVLHDERAQAFDREVPGHRLGDLHLLDGALVARDLEDEVARALVEHLHALAREAVDA